MVKITRPDEPKRCCGKAWKEDGPSGRPQQTINLYAGMKTLRGTPTALLKTGFYPPGLVFVCDHCRGDDGALHVQCEGCGGRGSDNSVGFGDRCTRCGCAMRISRTDLRIGKQPKGHICGSDAQAATKTKAKMEKAAAGERAKGDRRRAMAARLQGLGGAGQNPDDFAAAMLEKANRRRGSR